MKFIFLGFWAMVFYGYAFANPSQGPYRDMPAKVQLSYFERIQDLANDAVNQIQVWEKKSDGLFRFERPEARATAMRSLGLSLSDILTQMMEETGNFGKKKRSEVVLEYSC